MTYTGTGTENSQQYQDPHETMRKICREMIAANNTQLANMGLSQNQRRQVTEIVKDMLDQQTFTDAIKRMLNEANMIAYSQRVIAEQAPGIIAPYVKQIIPKLVKNEIKTYGKGKFDSWFSNYLKSDDFEKIKKTHLDEMTKHMETHTQNTITQILKRDARLNPVFTSLENITRERCDEKIKELTRRVEDGIHENESLYKENKSLHKRVNSLETRNTVQFFAMVVWIGGLTVSHVTKLF